MSAAKHEGETGALQHCFKDKWGEVVPQEEQQFGMLHVRLDW